MKNGLKHIIGKQIVSVVVAKGEYAPRQRLFLVFSDGTRFEFWGEEFSCCNGLDDANGIEECVEASGGRIVRVYGDVERLAPERMAMATSDPEGSSLKRALDQDLQAWREARSAVDKARARS